MSLIAQTSLLAAQASRVGSPDRAAERYAPLDRGDAAGVSRRRSDEAEPGQRKAPVDQIDIRVRTDDKRTPEPAQSRLAEQTQRTEEFEARLRQEDRVRDEERQERLSRREAPHGGREARPRPPGSEVNITV